MERRASHWFTGHKAQIEFTFNEETWDATGPTPDLSKFENSIENYSLEKGQEQRPTTLAAPTANEEIPEDGDTVIVTYDDILRGKKRREALQVVKDPTQKL